LWRQFFSNGQHDIEPDTDQESVLQALIINFYHFSFNSLVGKYFSPEC
jgi:phosphate starvation-inducible membrane PsiE